MPRKINKKYEKYGKDSKDKKKLIARKKTCRFCADKDLQLDYKLSKQLGYFLTERGKIVPRRISGTSAKMQRKLAVAIKRARHMAILPFVADNLR